MAQMEARLPEAKRRAREGAVVVESRLRRVRAPFSLRCGALLVDYTLAVGIVAFATLVARTLDGSERSTSEAMLAFGYLAALAVLLLNFLVLPVFTGATIGKWATGLRIERRDGDALGFGHATLRHTIGYLVSLLTLGFGFLLAVFDAEGRTLHDRLAGTIVVLEREHGGVRPRLR
ncbi:MAG: RDD family protein [Pyrinomonadaceae bacterium]